MKLSRTVNYALRATMLLAQEESNRPIPCSQLAREGEMPERFLLQILRNLVNQGLLRSTRGVDGGYSLAHNPSEVSVLNVIEAIDGPLDESNLPLTVKPEARGPEARLNVALRGVSATLCQQLDAIKIAHLIPPPAKTAGGSLN